MNASEQTERGVKMASSLGFYRKATGKTLGVLVLLGAWLGAATPAGAYAILHSFTEYPDVGYPRASLILDADGNLYGTAGCGTGGRGCVFRLKTDGTGYTILYSFTGYPDGDGPGSLILDAAGNLYGTTEGGGDDNKGTLFTLKTDGTGYRILHSFSGVDDDGVQPRASLILDAAGNLYGTTVHGGLALGGCDCGTVFTVKTDGSGYTNLHTFTDTDGKFPVASLILDAAGNLYGTTLRGGVGSCAAPGCGTVFTLKTDGTGYTILHFFTGGTSDGSQPEASLTLDAAGNLYGTTLYQGGLGGCNCGSVFTLKTDGTGYTILHVFNGGTSDGAVPAASLILDAAGNLYGTTVEGGLSDGDICVGGCGTVFTLRTDGTGYTISHFFDRLTGDGALPHASLILDPSGNFYGTTSRGGSLRPQECGVGQFACTGTVFMMP
jgi:uncharacterized repeat protein (TIGR03803 family)